MKIKLGKTGDPLNKLEKTITWPEGMELTGNLKEDTDIMDPVIEIETVTDITGYNYAYIEVFGRYYFIRSIEITGANLRRISMHVDVLQTYSSFLKQCPVIVANSYNRFNMYLPDANYKCYQNDKILINSFPGGFDLTHARFILTAFCDTAVPTS